MDEFKDGGKKLVLSMKLENRAEVGAFSELSPQVLYHVTSCQHIRCYHHSSIGHIIDPPTLTQPNSASTVPYIHQFLPYLTPTYSTQPNLPHPYLNSNPNLAFFFLIKNLVIRNGSRVSFNLCHRSVFLYDQRDTRMSDWYT